jgi:hypothetical protein
LHPWLTGNLSDPRLNLRAVSTLTPSPLPRPSRRTPWRLYAGGPTTEELWQLGGLACGALLLLLLAVHLLRSYGRSWSDPFGPGHSTLVGALASLAAAGGAGWWLYLELDHIAARMGVPLIFLLPLLRAAVPQGRGGRG